MDRPWLRVQQRARGKDKDGWIFTWLTEELNGVPTVVKWAEIDHPCFRVERLSRADTLPGRMDIVVRSDGGAGDVLDDVVMRLGIVWRGDEWDVEVPLMVRFDKHGHPDTEAGDAKTGRPGDPHEAKRFRILKLIDEHERTGTSVLLSASEMTQALGSTIEDIDYHLEVLERDGLVNLAKAGPGHSAWLTPSGKQYVREGVKPGRGIGVSIGSIGAVIGSMTGGNLQAIGLAIDSEVSQLVNDPEALGELLADLGEQLIKAVRAELGGQERLKYMRAVEELCSQLTAPQPDSSSVKRLLGTLAFMGDVEGTVGLITRVWPLIMPMVVAANQVLSNLPK